MVAGPPRIGVVPGFDSQASVTFFQKYCFPNLHWLDHLLKHPSPCTLNHVTQQLFLNVLSSVRNFRITNQLCSIVIITESKYKTELHHCPGSPHSPVQPQFKLALLRKLGAAGILHLAVKVHHLCSHPGLIRNINKSLKMKTWKLCDQGDQIGW